MLLASTFILAWLSASNSPALPFQTRVPAPRLPPPAPTPGETGCVELSQHGKLPWFQGSFDELLARAADTERIVFLYFWMEHCPYCTKLSKVTFASAPVLCEMQDVLCFAVEMNGKQGKPLARRYQVRGPATLAFLDPDGTLRDQLTGYLPAESLAAEVRRIKRNEGTLSGLRARIQEEPSDLGARWQLARKLKLLGDLPGYEEQVAAIREHDPEGRSLPSRRLRLEDLCARAEQTLQLDQLYELVRSEEEPELLFEAWRAIWNLEGQVARGERDPEKSRAHHLRRFEAARALWPLVSQQEVHGHLGNNIAWDFYENRHLASPADLEFALDIARTAEKAAPDVPAVVDTLACCLFAVGRREEALATVQRCIELDPKNPQWRERRAEFQAAR